MYSSHAETSAAIAISSATSPSPPSSVAGAWRSMMNVWSAPACDSIATVPRTALRSPPSRLPLAPPHPALPLELHLDVPARHRQQVPVHSILQPVHHNCHFHSCRCAGAPARRASRPSPAESAEHDGAPSHTPSPSQPYEHRASATPPAHTRCPRSEFWYLAAATACQWSDGLVKGGGGARAVHLPRLRMPCQCCHSAECFLRSAT